MNVKVICLSVILAGAAALNAHASITLSNEDFENKKVETARAILQKDHLRIGQPYVITKGIDQKHYYLVTSFEYLRIDARYKTGGCLFTDHSESYTFNPEPDHDRVNEFAQASIDWICFHDNSPGKPFIVVSRTQDRGRTGTGFCWTDE